MMDVETEAMNDVYDLTKKDSEEKLQKMRDEMEAAKEDARILGALQTLNYQQAHNDLIKYSLFYQIRQTKEYKKEGMTFEKFCEAAGDNIRNVQRVLKDLRSVYDQFSGNLSCFLNIPFNKIRYLGRVESGNLSQNESGDLILGDDHIPLTPDNKDEIEAAIDAFIESHKQEKKTLEKKLARATKETDKIVEEATKGLTVERDALIKEVERLKPYDITEKDVSWSVDLIEEMKNLVAGFSAAATKLIMDERLKEDMPLQARAEQMILLMHRMTGELNRTWDDVFNVYDD